MNSRIQRSGPEASNLNGSLVLELKAASGEWLTVGSLASRLKLSRPRLHDALALLESSGYDLAFHPQRGVRLEAAPDRLTAEEISLGLRTDVVGSRIEVWRSLTSTNDRAAACVMADCPDGTVVFAEKQVHGRGRFGRTWASPEAKGLWFSVVLRPGPLSADASRLTLMAAVAVVNAIRTATALPVTVRWPNDLVVRSRKTGGILVEEHGASHVIGIGVNVNYELHEMPRHIRKCATSLKIESGRPVDRIRLARESLAQIDRWYRRLKDEGAGAVNEAWRGLCSTLGRTVIIEHRDRMYRGLATDIASDGSLVVLLRGGAKRCFRSHEVVRLSEDVNTCSTR